MTRLQRLQTPLTVLGAIAAAYVCCAAATFRDADPPGLGDLRLGVGFGLHRPALAMRTMARYREGLDATRRGLSRFGRRMQGRA